MINEEDDLSNHTDSDSNLTVEHTSGNWLRTLIIGIIMGYLVYKGNLWALFLCLVM